LEHGPNARGQRYVFERSHIDEAQAKSGLGNETNFQASRRADKKDFGFVELNQLVGYGEGGNDVAASTASGNENSQFRQPLASL
jgi:hypothetical protein